MLAPDQPNLAPVPQHSKDRGWLWTVGAVILTAAVWAGVLVAVGRPHHVAAVTPVDTPDPAVDLRGYHTVDDLCAITDRSPITASGFVVAGNAGKNPEPSILKHPAVDAMSCRILFESPAERPGSLTHVQLDIVARLYRQADPTAEFTAGYQSTTKGEFGRAASERIPARVTGLGDDAYQLVDSDASDRSSSVELGIRDGWMVYQATWTQSVDAADTAVPFLSGIDAVAVLRKSAEATLPGLRT